MRTNDLKSGTVVTLSNGWLATLKDNKRGNIRLAEVQGLFTEIGSVYAHDIISAQIGNKWVSVEHTPAQIKLRKQVQGV